MHAYTTDNKWGIPALPLTACAVSIPLPVLQWGSYSRSRFHTGTTHFYTDDYRFSRLRLSPPSSVVVEPDYSTTEHARALTLYAVYRARQAAYVWGAAQAKIIANLNQPIDHIEIGLIGLPPGWHAYAWRAHHSDPESEWDTRLEAAQRHAGDRPLLLLVIGGGKRAQQWAQAHGAIWRPSVQRPWDAPRDDAQRDA